MRAKAAAIGAIIGLVLSSPVVAGASWQTAGPGHGFAKYGTWGGPTCTAGSLTINPVADTWVSFESGNNNYGRFASVSVGGASSIADHSRIFIRFDIAGTVPAGCTISAATLTLTRGSGSSASRNYSMARMGLPWTEGTGGPTTPSSCVSLPATNACGITWNNAPAAVVGSTIADISAATNIVWNSATNSPAFLTLVNNALAAGDQGGFRIRQTSITDSRNLWSRTGTTPPTLALTWAP